MRGGRNYVTVHGAHRGLPFCCRTAGTKRLHSVVRASIIGKSMNSNGITRMRQSKSGYSMSWNNIDTVHIITSLLLFIIPQIKAGIITDRGADYA